FRGGPHGWRDRQLPDGTIHWTLPTGHTRTTRPRSALILPDWDTTTATLAPPQPDTHTTTGATMPTRRRTRAQDRQQHITTERDHNAQQLALGHHIRIRPPHAVQKLFPP
ncbi:MAG: hypothetical protein K0R68_2991, partial [Mycobacterium sp.]|nr:hypothetical protein [Mycobacterium sp.]